MRKVFLIVLLLPLISTALELFAIGNSSSNLDEDALQFVAFVFFVTNIVTLFVVFWSMVAMMHKLANKTLPIKASSIVFALLKAGFTVIVWSLLFVMIISAVLGLLVSDQAIIEFVINKDRISSTHQLIIVLLSSFLFSMVYAVFVAALSGSILRSQLKRAKRAINTPLAKWHLPFLVLFSIFKQPLIWLPLGVAMATKFIGLFAVSKGYTWVSLFTEPAFYLAIFFSFLLSYTVYARPHTEESKNNE